MNPPSNPTGLTSARRGKWSWRDIVLELVIVFVGLFAALQLDTFNQQREFRESQHRYLERLHQEFTDYDKTATEQLELLTQWHQDVAFASDSLIAGEIIDGDTHSFERGLIYMGHLPSNPLPRTSYNEMVAAGMFTTIESEELKQAIAELYALHDFTEANFTWWRVGEMQLSEYLFNFVEFYDDPGPAISEGRTKNEPKRRVNFDFELLAADGRIRNGFYWAKDTHSDWVEWSQDLYDLAAAVDELILRELQ